MTGEIVHTHLGQVTKGSRYRQCQCQSLVLDMGSEGLWPLLVMRRINGHPQVNKGATQHSGQSHHGVGGLKAMTGTHDVTHGPREEMTSPILGEESSWKCSGVDCSRLLVEKSTHVSLPWLGSW